MDKRERDLRRLAKKYGLKLRMTRNNHFQFLDPVGSVVAVSSGSSGDRRHLTIVESHLKRR